MDMKKLQVYIRKMVCPGATVNSLTMFANKIEASYGHEGLTEFFAALCQMDICKAATVSRRLNGDCRSVAENCVYQVLTERCGSTDGFTHLELLAIAVCQDAALLGMAAPILTQQDVKKAMQSADELTACSLLRMGLSVLPQESCAWVREAFCKQLAAKYNERMEKALPELLPCLLEHDGTDVLSGLVEIAGAERVSGLFGGELSEELDRLIRSGKDSVGVWELYFCRFFQQEHTHEALLDEGLWYVQLFAGEDIYDQVCASFFLHAATRYGVEHPVFDCIENFIPPQKNTRRYIMSFKDAVRPLWTDPGALRRFLEKTAPCNPFRGQWVQGKRYHLLQTAQDRTAYNRLQGLYEAGLPAGDILNIFFSTDLKKRLPLEDVFYLAQRYEALPGLLEALRDQPFVGTVAVQDTGRICLSAHSYFTAALHVVPITYKLLEIVGRSDGLKGRKLQYVISDFAGGYIMVSVCGTAHLTDGEDENAVTWETAIEQLRREKILFYLTRKQLKQYAVTEFTLDDVLGECDLNLFTGLVMERPDCLEAFLKLLNLCKWNATFLKPDLPLPKNFFSMLQHYRQDAVELFRFLLEAREDITPVLQLYFSSIYRTIVPLNQLLLLAPRERLLEQLPGFAIHCRLMEAGSARCRLPNITYASVCAMGSTEGISLTDPFFAVVTDFTVEGNYISRILLEPYKQGAVDIKKQGALFGYLASRVPIDQRREQLIAALPSTADCGYRELKFNIRCMEDAVLLRRSNAVELKRLIQVLGDANPFAFGVSYAAERIYLSKKKRKEDSRDSSVSMVLNAKSIEDIRDFYLHTHIKYHLQLPRLAALICERRADLEDQIPGMFDGVTFQAIADSRGSLWMPWVAQDTIQVSREYAGQVLSCRVRLEKDGTVSVNVEQAEQSDAFHGILNSCLLSGYRTDQEMDALVESLQRAEPAAEIQPEDVWPDAAVLSYGDYLKQLKEIPHSDQFNHEDFARAIRNMIISYGTKSPDRMTKAVTALIRQWLHLHPDREIIPPLLREICRCFVEQYKDSSFCNTVAQLLFAYFGMEEAEAFKQQMLEYDQPQEDTNSPVPEKMTFAQACENVQSKLNSTFYVSRKLIKLIKTYHNEVSREEMEAALSVLTEQWMQIYVPDNAALVELLNIHAAFIHSYQSGAFGMILCQQAYRNLPDPAVDRLERGICKITYQSFADHPELKQMLPPYEQQLARLQARFQDPQCAVNDAEKRIGRLIRYYGSSVSAEEMGQAVLALMEQLLKNREDYPRIDQLEDKLRTAFEGSFGTPNIGKFLWQQVCRLFERDIACALQSQQPMPVQSFSFRIKRLIPYYIDYVSAEEMKQAILTLTAQWFVGAAEEEQTVSCLVGIHKSYAEAYGSAELGFELRRLGEQHLNPGAANTLNMRIIQSSKKYINSAPKEAAPLTPLDIRQEQIAQTLLAPEFRERNFVNKLHKLIHRYAGTAPAEEIARTVAQLAEQWMPMCPEEEQLLYILHGLHDCFMKYCGSEYLAGLFCRMIGEHMGEDKAKAFAGRLQESKRKLQGEDLPAEPDHTERK